MRDLPIFSLFTFRIRASIQVFFFLCLLAPFSAHAVNIVVDSTNGGSGGPSCTLADAIIAANTASPSGGCIAGSPGQDHIFFDSTIFGSTISLSADLPLVTDDLVVSGPTGTDQVTVSGDDAHAIFTIDGAVVEIFGMKLVHATRNGPFTYGNSGSAIRATNQAKVSIVRSHLSDNTSPGAIQLGGAVFGQNSEIRVSKSMFLNNQAHLGGALGVLGSQLYVERSRFADNVTFTSQQVGSVGTGGAVAAFSTMSLFQIRDSEFQGNESQYGGAVFIHSEVDALIEGTRFTDNIGPWGGAIRGQGAGLTLTLKNCHIAHNIGTVYGGAIYTELGRLNVLNSLIESNVGGIAGGAAFAYATQVVFEETTALANSAQSGGAVYLYSNLNNTNIPSATLNVNNSSLSENYAADKGGAAFLNEGSSAYITNSTFARNQADTVGGAFYSEGAILEISNSTLSQNTANGDGGVIYQTDSSVLKLSYSTLAENNGGSLFTFQSSQSILQNTVIAGGNCDQDASSQVTLVGGVHIDDGTCGAMLSGPSLLSGLANHGGPTETHIPLPGSPLIDQGMSGAYPANDQRGLPRVAGADIDIGSVEIQN